VSGFTRVRGVYDLTVSKAEHWHRYCDCGLVYSPSDPDHYWDRMLSDHLEPAGFEVLPSGSQSPHFIRLYGPGLVAGTTDNLYRAVAGRRIWVQ
jgi:hypothetical protein